MKYDSDVIRNTLSMRFKDFTVDSLMKDMFKYQHELNMRRQADIEAFVHRNRNVNRPKEGDKE